MEEGFKIVQFVDPEDIKNREKPDEFGRLFTDLEKEVCKLEDGKTKLEIISHLKELEKINDKELEKIKENNLLFAEEMIKKNINDIEELINKYEVYTNSERKIIKNNLAKVQEIREHCENYIGQA